MPSDIARYCPPDIRMKILSTANGARQRARTRGLPVDQDLCAFALELYRTQGGCCALSGLPFNLRVVGGGKAQRPYAPSLDRVDAASGYTRDNVRLVCQAVNFALNAYGEDVFREMFAARTPDGDAPVPLALISETERRSRSGATSRGRTRASRGCSTSYQRKRETQMTVMYGRPPLGKGIFGGFGIRVGSGHVSGLVCAVRMTAGPEGIRGSGSNHRGALEAR